MRQPLIDQSSEILHIECLSKECKTQFFDEKRELCKPRTSVAFSKSNYLRPECLHFFVKLMAMPLKALPLISFVRDDSPRTNKNPAYSAQLIEGTTQILTSKFGSRPFFTLFFYGSSCQNKILADLLKRARTDLENPEECFVHEKRAPDGDSVCVARAN